MWVRCISSSGKIQASVFRFCGFRVNPTGLERLFISYFSFFKIKIRLIYCRKSSLFNEKKHGTCNFLKEY